MKLSHVNNRAVIILDSPYELIGDFLTIEAYRTDSWVFTVLLPNINTDNFAYGGNAYQASILNEEVVVEFVVWAEIETCKISKNLFAEILTKWYDFLKEDTNAT